MHINQLKESKFLRKEDCGKGILVTIDHIEEQNVASSGQPIEMKHVLCWVEDQLPMVLNLTNAKLIAIITGSEDTDGWPGYQVVCYEDKTISFAGKITGGIRVRAPKRIAPVPQQQPVYPSQQPGYAPPQPAVAASQPVGYAPPRPAPRPAPVQVAPAPVAAAEPDDDDVPF